MISRRPLEMMLEVNPRNIVQFVFGRSTGQRLISHSVSSAGSGCSLQSIFNTHTTAIKTYKCNCRKLQILTRVNLFHANLQKIISAVCGSSPTNPVELNQNRPKYYLAAVIISIWYPFHLCHMYTPYKWQTCM